MQFVVDRCSFFFFYDRLQNEKKNRCWEIRIETKQTEIKKERKKDRKQKRNERETDVNDAFAKSS